MAVMRSSSASASMFTSGRPRAVDDPCGIWNTRTQYTLPALEKHSSVSWVLAMSRCSTKSSSLRPVAARPVPPRRCAWYAASGCVLA